MYLLSAELDPVILVVAGVAVLLLAALLVGLSQLRNTQKKIIDNQKVHNNLLLIIANKLNLEADGSMQSNEIPAHPASQNIK